MHRYSRVLSRTSNGGVEPPCFKTSSHCGIQSFRVGESVATAVAARVTGAL
jgi:hypothetical protein